MTNNYIMETRICNNDTWDIHYAKADENSIRLTITLRRPNKRFYQSKYIYEDWTYCSAENLHLTEDFIIDMISAYYGKQENKKKIAEFFNKPIDK